MNNDKHHSGYSLPELALSLLLFSLVSAIGLRLGQSSQFALQMTREQSKLQQKAHDAQQVLSALSAASLKNRLIPSLQTYRCANNNCINTSPDRVFNERLAITQSADQSDAILALEVDASRQLLRYPEANNMFCLNNGTGLSEISDSWLPLGLGHNNFDNAHLSVFSLNLKKKSPDAYCRRPYMLLGSERTPLWQDEHLDEENGIDLADSLAFVSLASADLIYLDQENILHRRSLLNRANQKVLKDITSLSAEIVRQNGTSWLQTRFSVADKISRQLKYPAQLPLLDPLDSIELPVAE